jgi:ABC-type glycerol-3-phosphate transport system substrate-binding protein
MKLMVETINANDIQARITASIQSGAGPDIFMTVGSWRSATRQAGGILIFGPGVARRSRLIGRP